MLPDAPRPPATLQLNVFLIRSGAKVERLEVRHNMAVRQRRLIASVKANLCRDGDSIHGVPMWPTR